MTPQYYTSVVAFKIRADRALVVFSVERRCEYFPLPTVAGDEKGHIENLILLRKMRIVFRILNLKKKDDKKRHHPIG